MVSVRLLFSGLRSRYNQLGSQCHLNQRWPARQPHVDIYRSVGPSVVGLTCDATFKGQPGSFFGTGVVVSSAGHVLSSTTVIPSDASNIKIYLTDGRILPGELVSYDSTSEGALLKVSNNEEQKLSFTAITLADSTTIQIGDPVYTVGNPHYTIQQNGSASLSKGHISNLPIVASVDDQSRYRGPVIEVDAAVNPGSDGGPLIDAHGRLIGLQSLAFSPARWLGLAIPLHVIQEHLVELAEIPVDKRRLEIPTWDTDHALVSTAKQHADAVVGIWVERNGDTISAPETWQRNDVPERDYIPSGRERIFTERVIPNTGSTGFLVSGDGLGRHRCINHCSSTTVDPAWPTKS